MSDENTKDKDFLARWSRRKRQARAGEAAPLPERPDEPPGAMQSEGAQPGAPESGYDLSNLPPIESIDAAADITAFLRKGIPQDLSRAALRRAWSADPAIRDFVGLAENAWDFNDPHAMPGFGPLGWSAEQVEALVRRVVGGVAEAPEIPSEPPVEIADGERSVEPEADSTQNLCSPEENAALGAPEGPSITEAQRSAAPQPAVATEVDGDAAPVRRRTHGGALPH